MSYLSQAVLVDDVDLRRRIVACAAIEGIDETDFWVHQHRWRFATQPGWEDAYEDAVSRDVKNPGGDPGIVSDVMILAAVRALRGQS